jgi:parallel beta-helix repeat protein
MKRLVSGIVLMLLLTAMFSLALNIKPAKSEPRIIIVPDNYATIQEAINAASPGDIVFVKKGTYREWVVIDKNLMLFGEDKNSTIIDGGAVDITQHNVTITGFTIQGSNQGIRLRNVIDCNITNNIIQKNTYGIWIEGSINNSISENNIINNTYGIWLEGYSNYNNVYRNTFVNNGIIVWDSYKNFVHDNLVNGKPLIYLENLSDYIIEYAGARKATSQDSKNNNTAKSPLLFQKKFRAQKI